MSRMITSLFIIFLTTQCLSGAVLINEVSAGGDEDWIEIFLSGSDETVDISSYFVTMYYGSNEKLSVSPVTLYSRDLPETPYDDRFAVIHFRGAAAEDETDSAGDLNNNRVRDIYCRNYGLWNTDCVIAIDTDDDPGNGGIIDFTAFTNGDGSPNSTITGYMKSASVSGQWIFCPSENSQECMVHTGENGLNSYSTLARRKTADSDSPDDFSVTPYATPGRENIFTGSKKTGRIANPLSDRITYRQRCGNSDIPVKLFIYEPCSVKVRIFTSAGVHVYSSELLQADPGYFTVTIDSRKIKGRKLTGLYPVKIESFSSGGSAESTIFLVIINER